MYFCANGLFIKITSSYVYVPFPTAIFVSPSIDKNEQEAFRKKIQLPHTENSKLAYLLIFN